MRWLYGGLLQVTDKACCRGCAGFVRSCYCEPTMHREEYNEHACQGQTKPCQPKKKHKRIIALLLHRYTRGSTDNLWGRSPHVAINALKKWLMRVWSKVYFLGFYLFCVSWVFILGFSVWGKFQPVSIFFLTG